MLLAIDVGNSHTVFGVYSEPEGWVATWRHGTNIEATEDELAAWLKTMFELAGLEWRLVGAVCGSVVPGMDPILTALCERYFGVGLKFLTGSSNHGVEVDYTPKTAVGADRIANAIGALDSYSAPIVVVDLGTATTFDVINSERVYVGGAILTGIGTSLQALVSRTAKLPAIELRAPETAIGKTTVHSIESGMMFGYAGAIDAIVRRISAELGGSVTVISTGGLGSVFLGLCESIQENVPMLTLDGLRLAHSRL